MPIIDKVMSNGATHSFAAMRVLLISDPSLPNMLILIASVARGKAAERQAPSATALPWALRSTLVDAAADDVVADLLEVARLRLDLLGRRVRPLIVDPALALGLGDLEELLDEELAVGVL